MRSALGIGTGTARTPNAFAMALTKSDSGLGWHSVAKKYSLDSGRAARTALPSSLTDMAETLAPTMGAKPRVTILVSATHSGWALNLP